MANAPPSEEWGSDSPVDRKTKLIDKILLLVVIILWVVILILLVVLSINFAGPPPPKPPHKLSVLKDCCKKKTEKAAIDCFKKVMASKNKSATTEPAVFMGLTSPFPGENETELEETGKSRGDDEKAGEKTSLNTTTIPVTKTSSNKTTTVQSVGEKTEEKKPEEEKKSEVGEKKDESEKKDDELDYGGV